MRVGDDKQITVARLAELLRALPPNWRLSVRTEADTGNLRLVNQADTQVGIIDFALEDVEHWGEEPPQVSPGGTE